ncbi:MAG TPA: hypothetical protein VE860_04360, partial [Chthoniobacterales bacterium]|nr:hypothetical protein [Chthoniobacterales bacterium]
EPSSLSRPGDDDAGLVIVRSRVAGRLLLPWYSPSPEESPCIVLANILGLERTTLTRSLAAIEREGLIQIASVDGRTRKL